MVSEQFDSGKKMNKNVLYQCESINKSMQRMMKMLDKMEEHLKKMNQDGSYSEIPSFNGSNSDEWISHAEKYFVLKCLNNEEQLQISASSFEGVALRWFRWENQRRPLRRWKDMKSMILRQFPSHPNLFLDPNPYPHPNPISDPYPDPSPISDPNPFPDPNSSSDSFPDPNLSPDTYSGSYQFLRMNPELDFNHESGMARDEQAIEGENSVDEGSEEKKVENRGEITGKRIEICSIQVLMQVPLLLSISDPLLPSPLPISPPPLSTPLWPSAYPLSSITPPSKGMKIVSVTRVQSMYEELQIITNRDAQLETGFSET